MEPPDEDATAPTIKVPPYSTLPSVRPTPLVSGGGRTMPNQLLQMVEICANGQVIRYQSTLTSIRSMYGKNKLSSRDVRLLRSSAPVLAPRAGYMLFDFGELRGILQHDRLILIGADLPAVGALGAEIQRRLEQAETADGDEQETAFEVRALECMLEQVSSVLDETLQTLRVLVSNTLRDLTNPAAVDSEGRREAALSRLLPLRIELSALQARTRRVSVLLDELLDSEDDLSDMCLTFLHSVESGAGPGASASAEAALLEMLESDDDIAAADEAAAAEAEAAEAAQDTIETLLDVYDARLNSLCDQLEQLTSTIENTQDVLELTLDNERNRIARLELLLSMAALSVGTCSAVSGFFGMNLLSGLESAAGLFVFVTGVSILLTGSLFITCWRQFRSISRRQRDRLMDVDALTNVLGKLDLVTLLLKTRPPLPTDRKAMREEVRQLLYTSSIAMSARELSVLCSLLIQQQQQKEKDEFDMMTLATQ